MLRYRLQTMAIHQVAEDTSTIRSLDWDRDRFDIEFRLERGTTYNSYIIKGDKVRVFQQQKRTARVWEIHGKHNMLALHTLNVSYIWGEVSYPYHLVCDHGKIDVPNFPGTNGGGGLKILSGVVQVVGRVGHSLMRWNRRMSFFLTCFCMEVQFLFKIWRRNMGVSKNMGKPSKSYILIWFFLINHPFWGTTIFGNIHIQAYLQHACCIARVETWQLAMDYGGTPFSLTSYEVKKSCLPSSHFLGLTLYP